MLSKRTVQKGAVLIYDDHKGATYVAASALTLGFLLASFTLANAAETPAAPILVATPAAVTAPVAATPATAAPIAPAVLLSVTFVNDDLETTFTTTAKTVADLLAEHGIAAAGDDYLSSPLDQVLTDGARIVYRPAVPVVVEAGRHRATLRTSAATVSDLLGQAHIELQRGDEVSPDLTSRPLAHEIVRVSHVTTWTKRFEETVAENVVHTVDASVLKGLSKTIDAGRPGLRVVVMRFSSRDGGPATKSVVSDRIVREPRSEIVAIGSGLPQPVSPVASFASAAQQGFASAVRIAGNAVHMIATAYTAGCYGCSGITAMGLHAGQGIVAVDPHFIPLGTKLWIPGYGPAIAGDTGGAINGNRIDLGMNTNGEAIQFGRRPITVYVIK